MLQGFYTGVSGIYYNQQKLGVVANNMANMNTTGFRRSLLMESLRPENDDTKWIDPAAKKRMPRRLGIKREGVYKNFQPGKINHTGNWFDLAINENLSNAFFPVNRLDTSDNEVYYTRNGTLSFGPSNPSDPGSPSVLYIAGSMAIGSDGGPINVDPTEGDIVVSKEGRVLQNGSVIDEIPLYRMNQSKDQNIIKDSNLQSLIQLGDSLFKIPPNLKDRFNPIKIEIGRNNVHKLMDQGVREGSNVNIISEMMQMMAATQATNSNQTAFNRQIEGLEKLFSVVRG